MIECLDSIENGRHSWGPPWDGWIQCQHCGQRALLAPETLKQHRRSLAIEALATQPDLPEVSQFELTPGFDKVDQLAGGGVTRFSLLELE